MDCSNAAYSPWFDRNECVKCLIRFGEYHCDICNLRISQSNKPFHCNMCGVCREGGAESFRHCDLCGVCVSAAVFDSHLCTMRTHSESTCPVCHEVMIS